MMNFGIRPLMKIVDLYKLFHQIRLCICFFYRKVLILIQKVFICISISFNNIYNLYILKTHMTTHHVTLKPSKVKHTNSVHIEIASSLTYWRTISETICSIYTIFSIFSLYNTSIYSRFRIFLLCHYSTCYVRRNWSAVMRYKRRDARNSLFLHNSIEINVLSS